MDITEHIIGWQKPMLVILILVLMPAIGLGQNVSSSNNHGANHGAHDKAGLPRLMFYEEYNTKSIPTAFVKLSEKTSPYLILVDKSQQKLLLYKYDCGLHRVKTFHCTTGSKLGNKQTYGDMRTPEGIYFFTDVYEKPNLIRTYGQKEALQFGIRAFTIDYPNEFDYIKNKEGYGIWLHGTDISERLIPTNTKGCIVLSDTDLEELTSYIILNNTPIIITKEITYKPASELETEYTAVTKFLEKWRRSWENRDFAAYEQTYSRSFKSGLLNLKQWVADKKQMLQKYSTVSITVSDLKILKADDYYVVEFYQEFLAGIYSDTGIKRLYLFNNEGKLEIMSEKWEHITPFK